MGTWNYRVIERVTPSISLQKSLCMSSIDEPSRPMIGFKKAVVRQRQLLALSSCWHKAKFGMLRFNTG